MRAVLFSVRVTRCFEEHCTTAIGPQENAGFEERNPTIQSEKTTPIMAIFTKPSNHIASNKVSPRPYLYCMVTGNKQSSSFVAAMTQHLSAPPAETMAKFGFLQQHRPYQPA